MIVEGKDRSADLGREAVSDAARVTDPEVRARWTWIRTCGISFVLTALVWMILSWPLPRHAASAIPCGVTKSAGTAIRHMEPGDHLQLLYHFWLFGDMLRGQTPRFGNVYEFNTDGDARRREPGAYYFPFSFFYMIGDALAGRAFGWNLAGFVSLWLALFWTFALVRRLELPPAWAWAVAVWAVAFPYRWHSLTGGSPSGFAMCFPPLLFLGLELALRGGRRRGSALAGAAVLLMAWTDPHVLFFSLLFVPLWALVAGLLRDRFPRGRREWVPLAAAPAVLLAALAAGLLTSGNMTGSLASSGQPSRAPEEVLLASPGAAGLLYWRDLGVTNQVYFGVGAAGLLLAGGLAALLLLRRTPRRGAAWALLVLSAGILAALLLALGFRGFHDGLALRAARALIPFYDLIRQPAKILTVMPTLLAAAVALGFACLDAVSRRSAAVRLFTATLLAGSLLEYGLQYRFSLCRLAPDQGAYAAAARDAGSRGEKPHALVLPLWPGDAHFTSVYQYFASLYRIRMVNGYRPFVPRDYREGFFPAFESANRGELSDVQLDGLQTRGVNTVVLHEDLFPEAVSPHPVGVTLKGLLNHPRLTLLAHDHAVWAWRIEREPHAVEPRGTNWTIRFPTQQASKAHPPAPLDIAPGGTLTLPAPSFFHAGTVDLEQDAVVLDPRRDRSGIALYGPRLAVPPGRYELSVDFQSSATTGELGVWVVESPEGRAVTNLPMRAGEPFVRPVELASPDPLLLVYVDGGRAALQLRSVTLHRLP